MTYQEYVVPGLLAMIVLFQSMQSALCIVYDRDAGVMRAMLISPLPRPFLLFSKIAAAAVLSLFQAAMFLLVARLFDVSIPLTDLPGVALALVMSSLMLGAIGLLVTVYTRQIENFASMMNFVFFPMFFLSSVLYPLWKLEESGAELVSGRLGSPLLPMRSS